MYVGGVFSKPFCLTLAALSVLVVGCGKQAQSIKIDGSSTVYPISEAVAESYRGVKPEVRVTVGFSGTGGGMKKFTAGEISICDASRGIKDKEVAALEAAKVPFTEFSVAFDGIAIVVHPENDWCGSMTVEQLASIWRPDDQNPLSKWSDIDPSWPDEEIKLYGPGTDSGTFDYFTKAIVGEEKASRSDYTQSEDDNTLVTGVSEGKYALGYFGFAYYAENQDKLKVIGVSTEEGAAPIVPTTDTIRDKSYAPLSRPLFIYVRNDLLETKAGAEFVKFYLDNAGEMAGEVGYVAVSDDVASENTAKFDAVVK